MRRDVFQAIADPTRRQIIDLLSEKESNLNDLIGHFDMSRPAVAKHVHILEECGIVNMKKIGREQWCSVQLETLGEIALWVHKYRRFWNERLDKLENLLNEDKDEEQ